MSDLSTVPFLYEQAQIVASNIIDDGYHGNLGIYDNKKILFWVEGHKVQRDKFYQIDKFRPVLLNIGPDLDPELFTLSSVSNRSYLTRVLYELFNHSQTAVQPLDCKNKDTVEGILAQCGLR